MSILGKDCTRWWIDFVKDKRSCDLYHENDCIAVACLKFCFMPILRDELHGAARLWNLHRILPSTNLESPSGRPDVLFFLPEVSGTRNCIIWMSTWTNWILLRRNAAIDIRKVVAQMNLHIYQKSSGKKVYNFLTHPERQQLCISPHLKK